MEKPELLFFSKFSCELFETDNFRSMTRHHYHDAYEIFFPVAGKRYMAFNGVRQLLQRGTVFIAQPFVPHGSECHESGYYKRYALNFSRNDLCALFSGEEIDAVTSRLSTGVYQLSEKQTDKLEACLERIADYHARFGDLARKLTLMQLFLTLEYLNSLLEEQQLSPASDTPPLLGTHPAVALAMDYVKLHYAEAVDLDFMASHVHLSKSQFCRVFRLTTGTTFLQFLNSYRLSRAHAMISHTKKPLHVIAEATGFYSTEHMTRTFEKTYHMSPSDWRRSYTSRSTQGQS